MIQSLLHNIEDIESIDGDDVKTEVSLSPAGSVNDLRDESLGLIRGEQQQQQQQQPDAASISSSGSSSSSSGSCGFWKCNFSWLQPLNQFELFLALLAISGFCTGIQGALKSAMLTKLEKRFNFDSKTSSLIMSANDMVFLPSVLIVSYFGSLMHRPRILALSCAGYGIASLMFSLPHFIFGSLPSPADGGSIYSKLGYSCVGNASDDADIHGEITSAESTISLLIFMLSGFLEGLSAAPYWNLGVAFVDDITGEMSGVFIGLIIAARILSPSIGYQLYGKIFVRISENLSPTEPQQMSHPRYVPAWWLGFVIIGFIAIFASFPMSLFPSKPHFNGEKYTGGKSGVWRLFRRLNRRAERRLSQKEPADERATMSFVGFFAAIRRLAKNPVYICLLCGNLFEFMEINCVIAYMAKYLELQFRIGSGEAAALTGIAVPGANAIGIIISSCIASQVTWRVPQLARFHAIVNCFGIVAAAVGFFFSCPTVHFQGGLLHSGTTFDPQPCNNNTAAAAAASAFRTITNQCSCDSKTFAPVCINSTNYFNPCSASCIASRGKIACGCAAQDKFPMSEIRNRVGQMCQDDCSKQVYIFIAIFVIVKLIRLSARSQEAVLQMRCVRQKDKALGLGVNSFVFSIGGIWVPTFVGFLFDKACIFHNPSVTSTTSKKSCLYYDADQFRYSFVGFTTAALIPACCFFFLAWYFTVRDPKFTEINETLAAAVIELPLTDKVDSADATSGDRTEKTMESA